ncbi:uncharacterized protein LOC142388684 [Odontesthes bonariensis]|uniref:uncharacterized protein LOC142388684 n=1 Tax=Odontesthes bonariensis TaxID=219752 RepID=UPI003F58C437
MRLKMVTLHDLAWMLCALIIAFGPPSGANAAPSRDPRNYNHGLMREIPQTRRPKIQCGVKGFQHCGEQTYDRLNEMCCNQSVVAKPAPMAECCGKEAIDSEKQLCCGPTKNKKILEKKTSNSQCCHHDQYDPQTECCCQDHKTTAVQSNQSDCCVKKREGVKGFQHCGEQTYDRLNEMCCNQSVVAKPAPMAECCGKEAIDSEKQLCCGPIKNKKILEKKTSNSQCCHHDQYDPQTECCCQDHEKTLVQSNQSDCCVKKREGVKGFQHCGEQTYDRLNEMCCNQSVVAKPAPMAECCGKEAIDSEKQLCCGPIKNKKILEKKTSNSQCCHYDQYDPETECCCQDHEKTLVQSNQSDCCVKKREGAKPKVQKLEVGDPVHPVPIDVYVLRVRSVSPEVHNNTITV